jgi:predicted transcriptional regulator
LINILLFTHFYQRDNIKVERQQSTAAAIDAWVEDQGGGRSRPRKITTAAIDGWLEDLDGGGRSGRV